MAKTLTQVGIETGTTVEAYHVTQSIDAFTGAEAYDIFLSGSFNMTGSINGQSGLINPLTASYAISASRAISASFVTSASYAISASHAISASFVTSASHAISASFVTSASYAISASRAISASFVTSASYAISASHAISASYVNLKAGPNITINRVDSSFEISSSSTPSGATTTINVTTQTYTIPGSGNYIIIQNHTGTPNCDITMPSTANLGDTIEIFEIGSSNTYIYLNGNAVTGQRVYFGSNLTSIGTGSIETQIYPGDNSTYLKFICRNSGSAANTGQQWQIVSVNSTYIIDGTIFQNDAISLT
jgi:hypothetical protein